MRYRLFINGEFYGGGPLRYMHELIRDYVITNRMYGRKQVEFKIVKEERE
jgi:hypothetical protein